MPITLWEQIAAKIALEESARIEKEGKTAMPYKPPDVTRLMLEEIIARLRAMDKPS